MTYSNRANWRFLANPTTMPPTIAAGALMSALVGWWFRTRARRRASTPRAWGSAFTGCTPKPYTPIEIGISTTNADATLA